MGNTSGGSWCRGDMFSIPLHSEARKVPWHGLGQQPHRSLLPQPSWGPDVRWDVQGFRSQNPTLGQCKLGSPGMPPPASLEAKTLPTWFSSAEHRGARGLLARPRNTQKKQLSQSNQTGDYVVSKRSEAMLRVEENTSDNRWELPFVEGNCTHISETVDFSSIFAGSGYRNEPAHTHSRPRLHPSFNLWLARK